MNDGGATFAPKESAFARLLRSPAGALIARPWFDRVALWAVTGPYCRLSRAWAAGTAAAGSLDRFLVELPLAGCSAASARALRTVLAQLDVLTRASDAAHEEWNDAFFGSGTIGASRLAEIERSRRIASHRHMTGRRLFLRWPFLSSVPAVRFDIPGPVQVAARFGSAIAEPDLHYRPPDPLPEITHSRRIAGHHADEYWLRFACPSPAIGGDAWARVLEPRGVADPPSLVYAHGLAVESDSLDGIVEGVEEVVRHGVRLVALQAPWHMRRRHQGWYGGEPFLATQPAGALDLFAAELREFATLIGWCRATSRGRVGIGGVSMGALASQLAASQSRHWPAALRPDLLYLATTSADLAGLALNSSLTRSVGLPQALAGAGWTPEELARWSVLTDPAEAAPLPPQDIIMLLGKADDVTPFRDGNAMAQRWRIPAANLFLRSQGHFSADLGLIRSPEPLHRVARRLHGH